MIQFAHSAYLKYQESGLEVFEPSQQKLAIKLAEIGQARLNQQALIWKAQRARPSRKEEEEDKYLAKEKNKQGKKRICLEQFFLFQYIYFYNQCKIEFALYCQHQLYLAERSDVNIHPLFIRNEFLYDYRAHEVNIQGKIKGFLSKIYKKCVDIVSQSYITCINDKEGVLRYSMLIFLSFYLLFILASTLSRVMAVLIYHARIFSIKNQKFDKINILQLIQKIFRQLKKFFEPYEIKLAYVEIFRTQYISILFAHTCLVLLNKIVISLMQVVIEKQTNETILASYFILNKKIFLITQNELRNQVSLKEFNMLAGNVASVWYTLDMKGYYLPHLSSSAMSSGYLLKVMGGKVFRIEKKDIQKCSLLQKSSINNTLCRIIVHLKKQNQKCFDCGSKKFVSGLLSHLEVQADVYIKLKELIQKNCQRISDSQQGIYQTMSGQFQCYMLQIQRNKCF